MGQVNIKHSHSILIRSGPLGNFHCFSGSVWVNLPLYLIYFNSPSNFWSSFRVSLWAVALLCHLCTVNILSCFWFLSDLIPEPNLPQGQNSGNVVALLRVAVEAAATQSLNQLRQLPQRGQVRAREEGLGRQRQPALVQGVAAPMGGQGWRARLDDDDVHDGLRTPEGPALEDGSPDLPEKLQC